MRFMVIVKASKESEAGVLPSKEILAEMGQFNEELAKAGVLLAGEGLQSSSKGARVRFSGGKRTVIDGPFAETKELVAGFWLWKCKSLQEAVEWLKRAPFDDTEVEIRQVSEAEDFGAEFTPELRNQEAALRAQTLGLGAPRFEQGRDLLIAGLNMSYNFKTRVNIPAQWQRFAPHIGNVPGQIGRISYGVCWNYRPGTGFDYLSGVEVRDSSILPAEFAHVRLPACQYVVFTHREHVSSIGKTIDTIWNQWVPQSGLKMADAPCFECYTEEFNPQTGMGGMEIWIPLEAQIRAS
jgi:AraC family transcriptional regulator